MILPRQQVKLPLIRINVWRMHWQPNMVPAANKKGLPQARYTQIGRRRIVSEGGPRLKRQY